ncbi:MAG: NAD-dependent epimerase/dehydratase family protein [Ignavibacteriales bacterium]|nr:NAD-dependent epimerase/dehydratase family protein [Ignavibacteriales bacterium]
MKIKAIITGSTGMVGEGVLHICLNNPNVESVLVINRKSCGVNHPKLKEIIHKDFMDLTEIEEKLVGYNACYFCAGVSSVGKKEEEYRKITYNLTLNFAKTLHNIHAERSRSMNKSLDSARDERVGLTFMYVSGTGTDSTEKGKSMWARIKGKTENDLLNLGFKDAYMFRPGYIQPIKGLKNTYTIYKFLSSFYPIFEKLFPKYVISLEELGKSMINVTLNGYEKKVLENVDIRITATN